MKDKVIIFPDIHGRKFWKQPLKDYPRDQYPDMRFVFLGDYLDPYYPYEDITKEDAFVNFEEILDTAAVDDRIILLIGNHDWHYFVNLDSCRMDRARSRDIEHMFVENIRRFRVSQTFETNDKKYLLTHAGITKGWIDDVARLSGGRINRINSKETIKWTDKMSRIHETYDFELLEQCLQNYDDIHCNWPLSMVSDARGGWDKYGSCIWADVHEHILSLKNPIPYYQIFGHTITYPDGQYTYQIGPDWAMIDASQAFVLTTEGELKPYDNGLETK